MFLFCFTFSLWNPISKFFWHCVVCRGVIKLPFLRDSNIEFEPPHGKTNNLHRRKQRCRSASFVFATRIVQFFFFLNPKSQDSSCLLWLYSPVCVGPVRKPHCWSSHEAAHLFLHWKLFFELILLAHVCHHFYNRFPLHSQGNYGTDVEARSLPSSLIQKHISRMGVG